MDYNLTLKGHFENSTSDQGLDLIGKGHVVYQSIRIVVLPICWPKYSPIETMRSDRGRNSLEAATVQDACAIGMAYDVGLLLLEMACHELRTMAAYTGNDKAIAIAQVKKP